MTVAAAAPTTAITKLACSLASGSLACLFARSIAHSLGPTDGDGGGADDGDSDARARSNGSPVPVAKGARLEVSGARRAEGAVQLAAPVAVCLCTSATAAAPTKETTTLARSLASRSLACLFARSIARSLTRSGRRTATVAAAAPTTATTHSRSLVMARPFPLLKARGSK